MKFCHILLAVAIVVVVVQVVVAIIVVAHLYLANALNDYMP